MMRTIEDVRAFDEALSHVVLTIGSFDGVHRGHAAIIDEVVRRARAVSGTAAVLTLTPHPRMYFAPDNPPRLLTSDATKARLLAAAGIDILFCLPFHRETAGLDRRQFVEEIILRRCHARELVVGHDFRFGRQAQGNYRYLQDVSGEFGFSVDEVTPVILEGERVSSTRIRELLAEGECEKAAHMLGRPYSLSGEVIEGRGKGRELGYPTANVQPHHSALPADGIYIAEVCLTGARHAAAVNVGFAPTLPHDARTVEAYLLDFEGDLVGREIEVVFHRRIRPEQRFESLGALTDAIARDVSEVREFFSGELEL